jgi:hypothetical protein
MDVTKMIPLATMGGLGYSESDSVKEVVEVPVNVAKVAVTQMELSNISKMVLVKSIGGDLPDDFSSGSKFPSFIQANFHSATGRDASVDFWGEEYQAAKYSSEYQFWSYGPDGEDDTEDDVWVTLPLEYMQ